MGETLNEDTLYYFLCPFKDRYYTLYLGWLNKILIEAFRKLGEEEGHIYIQSEFEQHTFINYIDQPLFLIEFDKEGIEKYYSDDHELELEPEEGEVYKDNEPDTINYPAYFTKGIESLLDYKLGKHLYANVKGEWIQIKL